MTKLKEAIDFLNRNGYIVETFNTIDQDDNDIDGDSFNGSPYKVTFGNKEWSGNDYNDWFSYVHDKVLDACYSNDLNEYLDEILSNEVVIKDCWRMRKWPSETAYQLIKEYL